MSLTYKACSFVWSNLVFWERLQNKFSINFQYEAWEFIYSFSLAKGCFGWRWESFGILHLLLTATKIISGENTLSPICFISSSLGNLTEKTKPTISHSSWVSDSSMFTFLPYWPHHSAQVFLVIFFTYLSSIHSKGSGLVLFFFILSQFNIVLDNGKI